MRHMMDNSDGISVFNLGTGHGVSVMELVKKFEIATGLTVPYKIAPRRSGDVPSIWADASLAYRVLGWRAETPLQDTLASAWRWQEKLNNK